MEAVRERITIGAVKQFVAGAGINGGAMDQSRMKIEWTGDMHQMENGGQLTAGPRLKENSKFLLRVGVGLGTGQSMYTCTHVHMYSWLYNCTGLSGEFAG